MATNPITPGSSTMLSTPPNSFKNEEAIRRSLPTNFTRPISSYSTSTLRSFLARILETSNSKFKITNWGGTFQSTPDRIFQPKNVDHCLALVELARREFKSVRAVGRAHSPSDLMMTGNWAIRMQDLQGVLEADTQPNPPTVTVLAGTYISALHVYLAGLSPPLALSNVGSISEQTIGGLISTATHGTGIDFPVISAFIQSMTLVCPLSSSTSGTTLVKCSRTENPALFNSTLCGLGSTGLIVQATIAVEPAFRLRQIQEEVSINWLLGKPTQEPSIITKLPDKSSDESWKNDQNDGGKLLHVGSAQVLSIGKILAVGGKLPRDPPKEIQSRFKRSKGPQHIHPFLPEDDSEDQTIGEWELRNTFDEATERAQRQIVDLVHTSQHVRIMWNPHVGMCTVLRADRSYDAPISPTIGAKVYHAAIGFHFTQLLLFLSRYHSALPPYVGRIVYWLTHPKINKIKSVRNEVTSKVSSTRGHPLKPPPRPSSLNDTAEKLQQQVLGSSDPYFKSKQTSDDSQPPQHMASSPSPLFRDISSDSFTSTSNFESFSSNVSQILPASSGSTPLLKPLHTSTEQNVRIDNSHTIFNMDCLFPQYTSEWSLPFENTGPFLRAMRDWLDEEANSTKGERIHFPVEIRFTDADGIWLSPSYGGRRCYVGLIMFRPYNLPVRYRGLFSKFSTLMRYFSGRPHWAKSHDLTPKDFEKLLPHWNDFKETREWADPEGVFENPYIRRHLKGEISEDDGQRRFKSRL